MKTKFETELPKKIGKVLVEELESKTEQEREKINKDFILFLGSAQSSNDREEALKELQKIEPTLTSQENINLSEDYIDDFSNPVYLFFNYNVNGFYITYIIIMILLFLCLFLSCISSLFLVL
jgi:hypothetical protein